MIRTLLTTTAFVALLSGGALAGSGNTNDEATTPQRSSSEVSNPTAPEGTVDHNRATNRNDDVDSSSTGSSQVGEMPRDGDPNLNRATNKNRENDGVDTQVDGVEPNNATGGSVGGSATDPNRSTNDSGG